MYNYAYLEDNQKGNNVKYNTFHREQQNYRKAKPIPKALFRRFGLRGLKEVKTDGGLVCIACRMQKLAG